MTVATVQIVAARFLKSDTPGVLALKGAWGVGKTHAWKELVVKCKDEIKLKNYCYVSLFGISSIQELKVAIFTKTQSMARLGGNLDAETINNEWLGIAAEQAKKFIRSGSKIINELPYGKNLTVSIETLAPHFIRKTIVCLDDFERLVTGTGTIKPEEILGLISELKEEKGCKVVLIFNEEKLSDKDTYSKYREKVVDIELLYDPTPEEAAEIALPPTLPYRELAKMYCITLGVKNIRVLRKIAHFIETMNGVASQLHPRVMEQAVSICVLLAWCYFDLDEKKPTIQFLRTWHFAVWALRKNQGEEVNPNHSAWNTLLQSYGFRYLDEFDLSIIGVIEQGDVEDTGFVDAANFLDTKFKAEALEQSFTNAWKLFNNSFADNREELIQALDESFKKSVKQVSPRNLDATVSLLRTLDKNNLADNLIDFYLNARCEENGIFDLENSHFYGDIVDSVIRQRFKDRYHATKPRMPLSEAVMYITDHAAWDSVHIDALLAATEDDYFTLFKQDHGDQLSRMISCCLRFEGNEDKFQPIGTKTRAALVRIGKENPLNAIRVSRYNIIVDKQPNASYSD